MRKYTFHIQILRGFFTGIVSSLFITLFALIVAKSTSINKEYRILILTIPLAAFLTT
ncbi:MAG: hypothetical protein IJ836_09095 [Spirochaetales bacterium]|nr:hypothetical protein [Spirochaetales bacterium]